MSTSLSMMTVTFAILPFALSILKDCTSDSSMSSQLVWNEEGELDLVESEVDASKKGEVIWPSLNSN